MICTVVAVSLVAVLVDDLATVARVVQNKVVSSLRALAKPANRVLDVCLSRQLLARLARVAHDLDDRLREAILARNHGLNAV